MYDQRTNTTKVQNYRHVRTEDVYELPFNEKNLKALFSKRESDTEITFAVKDEAKIEQSRCIREPSINDTLKLFLKPFNYLYKAEYISQRTDEAIRQANRCWINCPDHTFS